MPTPGAQCLGPIAASLALLPRPDPRAARDAELGLRAVAGGALARLAPGRAQIVVSPPQVVVCARKPADRGDGIVLRLLNPTDAPLTARIVLDLPVAHAVPVRLDETEVGPAQTIVRGRLEVPVPPHALRSVLLRRRAR
jgi:alpha-mannosidase